MLVQQLFKLVCLVQKLTNFQNISKNSKKDKHSFRGLTKSVNQRKRLLSYLEEMILKAYSDILKKLNLRK